MAYVSDANAGCMKGFVAFRVPETERIRLIDEARARGLSLSEHIRDQLVTADAARRPEDRGDA